MQPLEVSGRTYGAPRPDRFPGLSGNVGRARGGIDYRGSRDSDLRVDVAGLTGIGRRSSRDARPEEALRPVLDARLRIGVEGIDAVVLGGDQNDVVRAGRYRGVRDIERLRIDLGVHGAREQLAEGRTGHRGGGQGKLPAVLSGPLRVVALRENARQVGHAD